MRQLIEERGIKDMDGVHALVKELTAGLIQECMDADLEEQEALQAKDWGKCDMARSPGFLYR